MQINLTSTADNLGLHWSVLQKNWNLSMTSGSLVWSESCSATATWQQPGTQSFLKYPSHFSWGFTFLLRRKSGWRAPSRWRVSAALRNNILPHKVHYWRWVKFVIKSLGGSFPLILAPEGFKLPREILVTFKLYLLFSAYWIPPVENWANLCFLLQLKQLKYTLENLLTLNLSPF